MSTKEALDQWASKAVALSVYECMLAAASRLKSDAAAVLGEAWWVEPTAAEWAQWQQRRRNEEGPTRAEDEPK